MRKKSRAFTSIDQILGKSVKRPHWKDEIATYRLFEKWTALVGPAIAKHASPSRLQRRTLVLAVSNPSWMHELTYMKDDLLEKIQGACPSAKIENLRFEIGVPAPVSSKRETLRIKRPLSHEEKEFIEQAAMQVHDDELKETVRRAMTIHFQVKR